MCSASPDAKPLDPNVVQNELYMIDEKAPLPTIDKAGDSLCGEARPSGLKGVPLDNFLDLTASMNATLKSKPACPGDGNEDKRVNFRDAVDWFFFATRDGGSSWYDFDHNGVTNEADLDVIINNFGNKCLKKK